MEQLRQAFADPEFSATEWINGVLREYDGDATAAADSNGGSGGKARDGALEAHVAALSAKLQVLGGDVDDELEARMADIFAALPRTLGEVERIERAARGLAADLASLTDSLDALQASGGGSGGGGSSISGGGGGGGSGAHLELLARLDLTRGNMDSSLATLREAANWEALARALDAKFAAGDLAGVAETWEGMARSVAVLAGLPGAPERARALADAQARLEAALRPKLQAALAHGGGDGGGGGGGSSPAAVAQQVAVLAECVDLYRRVGQLAALQEDYTRARPAAVHKFWFARSGGDGFVQWLPSFFLHVGAMLAEERRRAAELFGAAAAPAVLCRLVERTFQPIAASFTQRLRGRGGGSGGAAAEAEGAEWWPLAVASYSEVTLPFAAATMEQLHGASDGDRTRALLAIAAPYAALTGGLGAAEAEHLARRAAPALRALTTPLAELPAEMLADPESAFLPRVEEVLALLRGAPELATAGAVERCLALTDGAQFAALVGVLDVSLADAYAACAAGVARTRALCGALVAPAAAAAAPSQAQLQQQQELAAAAALGTAPDAPPFDWAFLQGGLQLLHAAGALELGFEERERELAAAAARAAAALLTDDAMAAAPHDGPAALRYTVASCSLQGAWHSGDGGGSGGGGGGGSSAANAQALRMELEAVRFRAETLGESGGLMGAAARGARAVAAAARELVFDLCFYEVARGLAAGGSAAAAAADAFAAGSAAAAAADAFAANGNAAAAAAAQAAAAHCLPQPHVTRVGEHLLSLLQQLEAFATGDAAACTARASQELRPLGHAPWRPLAALLQLPAALAHDALPLLADGAALLPYVVAAAQQQQHADDSSGGDAGETRSAASDDAAGAQFCQDWLAALGAGAVGAFVCAALAGAGARRGGGDDLNLHLRQLGADAAYLENVHDALDLAPHPLLSHVARLCEGAAAAAAEGGGADAGAAAAAALLRERDAALAPDSDDAVLLVLRRLEQRLLGDGGGGGSSGGSSSGGAQL